MTMAGVPPVAAGAIQGGANGYAETGNPVNAALGAGVGALGAGAAQGIGALARYLGILPKVAPTVAAAPTQQMLHDVGGQQFDALRASGATFDPIDVRGIASKARADLGPGAAGEFGTAPYASRAVSELSALAPQPQPNPMQAVTGVAAPAPAPVPVEALDALRKGVGEVRGPSVLPSDQRGAGLVRDRILELYDTNPAIADLSAQARGNSAADFRSQTLQNLLTNAENRGSATGSGMNTGNSIRQRVATLIDPNQPGRAAGLEADMPALQRVVDGSMLQNAARKAGNALGGGGGLGGAFIGIAGAHAAGPAGAALPFVGAGFKHLDNLMAARALRAVDEATRMRSPLGAQIRANFVPPAPPVAPGAVPATIGGLLGAYVGGSGQ